MSKGNNLKKIRERKALSIDDVAGALNINKEILQSLEKNECETDMQTLKMFADYYGINVEDILDHDELKKTPSRSFSNSNDKSLCEPWGNVFHYEYRSKTSIKGIPLVHINVGVGAYSAKGIVAVGNFACGIISIGGISVGILSIGLLCIGLLALGILALGVFAMGAVALGVFAIGGASIGYRAIGGATVQSQYFSGISEYCGIDIKTAYKMIK